jgi:hypothetical protein
MAGYTYKGVWDASSGSAPSTTPAAGDVYLVTTAGHTVLNSGTSSISQWYVGDQVA